MSFGGIDGFGTAAADLLDMPVYGNPLGTWLVALGLLIVVAIALPLIMAHVVRRLHVLAGHDGALVSHCAAEIVGGTPRSVLNRELMRRLKTAGIDFAFPTRTVQVETLPVIAPEPSGD